MALHTFLEPAYLLQTIVLALSIFNLVSFLWLAVTVWLNGDRKSGIARLGVVGLGLSALFFFIHALLISSPLTQSSGFVTSEFLWHLIWLPALGVPYIWFAIGLYYAALINEGWRKRRPFLLLLSGILGCVVLLLLILNQSAFTFVGTLRLIAYNDALNDLVTGQFSSLVLVPVLFLCYVTFCAIGPWFTFGRISRLLHVLWDAALSLPARLGNANTLAGKRQDTPSLRQALLNAFWDDPADVELLEEPYLSWHLARPGLLLAALLMAALTTTLGILVIQSIVNWIQYGHLHVIAAAPQPPPSGLVLVDMFPLNLVILDLSATLAVALVILLIGYSIVRHGILIERSLPRRGFFEQWRGIVIVATALAIFIAILVTFSHSHLGGLLLITSLASVAYALFTWSSYTAHDRYIALLGPFVRSTSLRHWLNTDLQRTEQDLETLFFHLCHDVLAVQFAYLTVTAGTLKRNFSYRWPLEAVLGTKLIDLKKRGNIDVEVPKRIQITLHGQSMICWLLPIYDERGLVAALYLGPREDGGAFTDEDMDLAQACGQRILDTLGDHEAMQAVAGLLRRRIVDVKLLGAQQRRVLHDEILPQMHLALLRLETLRSLPDTGSTFPASLETSEECREQVMNEAIDMISDAHRRLATMMRTTAPTAPHRLERDGMMYAIRTMLEQDFQNAFDEIDWGVSEETAALIDEVTPPAIAELIFAAVQEALRNAARHARGTDVHRRLCITLSALYNREGPYLEVIVADDGVGITSASSATTGTGGGLLTHSALLAIAGGSLNIKSSPGEGVTVKIVLPAESLR
ncbi:MAG TPA: ATP-binding protein [Ktedonobacteraceae bacterium]